MAEAKTKGFTVVTEKTDPNVQVEGKPLVVSTRTLTVDATSEADAKKQVDLAEGESVISVTPL
jgi:hypothetical protein